MANSLKVLGNNDLKELFNSGSYMYKEFTNYTDENTAEHNYNKPETEWKEIIGVKDGVVEILNSNDEIITIELPEGILSKEE
jgi:hypothetical protein